MLNANLNAAKKAKKDEFCTQYADGVRECDGCEWTFGGARRTRRAEVEK